MKKIFNTNSVILFCWGICLFLISLVYMQSVYYFNRTPWDGTFQTLFPLLKMNEGLYPGRDFFYFHGNGIPYLIYPLYYVLKNFLGQSHVISALHATFIVNTVFIVIPFYYLLRLKYSNKATNAILLSLMVIFNSVPYSGGYLSPLFLGAPMAIRFSPHIIMAITVYWFLNKEFENKRDRILPFVIYGLVSAISIYIAAEQGFYAVGASLIVICIYYLFNDRRQCLITPLILLVTFVIELVIITYILMGNLDTLKAIAIISNDQSWVFGVFPNKFYDELSEVFTFELIEALPSQVTTLAATGLAVLFIGQIVFRKLNDKKVDLYSLSLLVLYFGSLLSWASNVGYIGAHQATLNIRFILVASVFILIEYGLKEKKDVYK